MNKEALKSIYAYNMLFNNSSGSNADGDIKLNTHLISDFDLQNFNPKRFEYYTTLLKMFDNDPETLSNVLNKYYSVKSLKVKERKLIREINDYVNKINKTTVGGGAKKRIQFDDNIDTTPSDTTITGSKLIEDLEYLKNEYENALTQSPASGSNPTFSATQTPKKRGTPSHNSQTLLEQSLRKTQRRDKFTNAIDEFIKAIGEFEQREKDKEAIGEFEQRIDKFNEVIMSYDDLQSGGITIKEGKSFIENIKLKRKGNNSITPPPPNILNKARTIIEDARKLVRVIKKELKKEPSEDSNAACGFKAQVFATKGLYKILEEQIKEKAVASSNATQGFAKEAKIISAKASALEAYAEEYVAFANLQVEKAKGEYEKAQAALASLPPDTIDKATKYKETIEKVRTADIAVSRIKVYDAFKKREELETKFTDLQTAQTVKTVAIITGETTTLPTLNLIRRAKRPTEITLAEQVNDDAKKAIIEQQKLLYIAETYKPITGNDIPNIILIQKAVKDTKKALDDAKNEAQKAQAATVKATEKAKIVRDLVKEVEEEEKKATKAANKANLIGQELAKKAETSAQAFIEDARKSITELEEQKKYAYDCVKNADVALEEAKTVTQLVTVTVIKSAQGEAEEVVKAQAVAVEEQEAEGEEKVNRQLTLTPLLLRQPSHGRRLSINGGSRPEEKYSDDTLKAQYLEKQRYRSIPSNIKEEFRNVRDENKGKVVRIKTDNKIDQLSNDIDTYNALSIEDREDNTENIIKKIKDFENDPQNPLDELEITLDDRIVFIIATFFIRYITLLMVQWCIDINIITSFYEGFIYYAIIYIILFWFVVLFINIDNSYDVKYMNFNGIINSIRSLFYYFYMGTNGISRLLIHTSLIILLIVIPIILNIKKKPEFKDEANHDDTAPTVKILSYDERKQLSKTLTLFTMFIWLFTSIIATKF